MDWLTDLFNWDDIEKKTDALMKDKYGKARAAVESQYGGGEAQADLDIAAQRQGIMGSPLASTLKARLATDLANKKGQAVAGLESQQAGEAAQYGIQNAMASNQAKAQLIGGITQGIFGGLGTLAGKIFPATI